MNDEHLWVIRKRDATMDDEHVWYLSPKFDRAKSFYGKAVVEEDGDKLTLYSYKSKVCEINKRACKSSDDNARDYVTIFTPYRYDSATTVRHIKEFLKQYGFKAETKNQIFSDYKLV